MNIIFCGIDTRLCAAWEAALSGADIPCSVSIIHGDITTLEVGAVVSPANSFGFMDGGVDLAYSHTFGWHVQDRLQGAIKTLPLRELLVGQAISVETGDQKIPHLIAAPTMRVPCRLADVLPVFLAARAATLEALRLELSSVAFPGMGTGTGGAPYEVAAAMMLKGILEGLEKMEFPRSLRDVLALRV